MSAVKNSRARGKFSLVEVSTTGVRIPACFFVHKHIMKSIRRKRSNGIDVSQTYNIFC